MVTLAGTARSLGFELFRSTTPAEPPVAPVRVTEPESICVEPPTTVDELAVMPCRVGAWTVKVPLTEIELT